MAFFPKGGDCDIWLKKKKKKCQSRLGMAYTVLMARFSAGVAAEIEQDFLTL